MLSCPIVIYLFKLRVEHVEIRLKMTANTHTHNGIPLLPKQYL